MRIVHNINEELFTLKAKLGLLVHHYRLISGRVFRSTAASRANSTRYQPKVRSRDVQVARRCPFLSAVQPMVCQWVEHRNPVLYHVNIGGLLVESHPFRIQSFPNFQLNCERIIILHILFSLLCPETDQYRPKKGKKRYKIVLDTIKN